MDTQSEEQNKQGGETPTKKQGPSFPACTASRQLRRWPALCMHTAIAEAEPARPFLPQFTLCIGLLSCPVMPLSRAPPSHPS